MPTSSASTSPRISPPRRGRTPPSTPPHQGPSSTTSSSPVSRPSMSILTESLFPTSSNNNNNNNNNLPMAAASPPLPRPVTTSLLPTYKILLVGDAAVGKSNLLSRFANNTFDIASRSTIGVEFVSREVELPTERSGAMERVNIQLWDTAGQERCSMISSAYFRNAKGIAVVYDVTRKESLLNVPRWVAHAKQFTDETCAFVVIGNKMDLKNLMAVTEDEAEEIAHVLGVRHFYASALTGDGVPSAFLHLLLQVNSLVRSMEVAGSKLTSPDRHPNNNGSPVNVGRPANHNSASKKGDCC